MLEFVAAGTIVGSLAVIAYLAKKGDIEPTNIEESLPEEEYELEDETIPQTDPTPDHIREIGDDLTQIKGVGDAKAQILEDNGYYIAADVFFGSDEHLESLHTFGPSTVEMIREDLGHIEEYEFREQ